MTRLNEGSAMIILDVSFEYEVAFVKKSLVQREGFGTFQLSCFSALCMPLLVDKVSSHSVMGDVYEVQE
ncbi:hypothetical protein H5410_007103 [Solanum commersonii]|uniref:Uncharacterized protein n=1 Tax=Solanum commersonii TaxID=4109 RepID=A0A9J6AB60_SOLCO|nr:hypothetical protein H5410_007103 [Solanum commersonii]